MKINSILLICTGNICRSPIAEHLLRQKLADADIKVSSAGTSALVGAPADPSAIQLMQHRGLDLSSHRARQASREQLSQSDFILVLDRGHKQWLSSNFPHLVGRIFKLGFWNGDIDVEDPYRRPYEAFQRAASDIERHVDSWVNKMR